MNPMANQLLLAAIVLILALIWLLFYRKNKRLTAVHRDQTDSLKIEVSLHQSQIEFRQESLNRYDFLRYNIKEALIVQQEIKLN